MVTLRHMDTSELHRVQEINVSESDDVVFRYVDGGLVATPEMWHRRRRDAEAWSRYIEQWSAVLGHQGGVAIGAFSGSALAGIAVLRYQLEAGMAQLVALFVSADFRRRGIAARLVQEGIRLAKEHGASMLYVSATPSRSAVGFYTSQGFELAARVHPDLYALEPEDIHMTRPL